MIHSPCRRLSLLLSFILLISFVLAHSPESPIVGIIDITNDNVPDVLDDSKSTLVEFYAPWCSHCQNMVPEMTKLGMALSQASEQDKSLVQVAKVNCQQEREICANYDISGYPTILFIPSKELANKQKESETTTGSAKRGASYERYSRGRKLEDFVRFLNEKTGSSLELAPQASYTVELTDANFDSVVMQSDKAVLVAFYAPWCGYCKKYAPYFEKAAELFKNDKDIIFALIDAAKYTDLGDKYGIQGYPTLKLFDKSESTEKEAKEYTGGYSYEGLVKFVNEAAGTNRF